MGDASARILRIEHPTTETLLRSLAKQSRRTSPHSIAAAVRLGPRRGRRLSQGNVTSSRRRQTSQTAGFQYILALALGECGTDASK